MSEALPGEVSRTWLPAVPRRTVVRGSWLSMSCAQTVLCDRPPLIHRWHFSSSNGSEWRTSQETELLPRKVLAGAPGPEWGGDERIREAAAGGDGITQMSFESWWGPGHDLLTSTYSHLAYRDFSKNCLEKAQLLCNTLLFTPTAINVYNHWPLTASEGLCRHHLLPSLTVPRGGTYESVRQTGERLA